MDIERISDVTVAFYDGPIIAREANATGVIGACYGQGIDLLAIAVESLADDFFWLSSGLAGAVLQKFQNYGFRVAILGDISRFTAESPSLRDFVHESNRRGQVLFLPGRDALAGRL
ncbi:MAG: hypothetical protein JWQ89_910 [Devosia sp.]|uniref:DUF4180 domain-containing protein n=1 Tax=Devosia sp. TaxID=1871048 RepID=UPI002613358B|nr:DUF4180 domain-containing protein [Devosia sp.]MDB5539183.1 hypothetical protein [Devosia sp.]